MMLGREREGEEREPERGKVGWWDPTLWLLSLFYPVKMKNMQVNIA